MNPLHWRLAKLAMALMIFGYVPMVLALKVLRGNHAFDIIGSFFQ